MNPDYLKNLLERQEQGTLTPSQLQELEAWYKSLKLEKIDDSETEEDFINRMYLQFDQRVDRRRKRFRLNSISKIAIAASLFICLTIGLIIYSNSSKIVDSGKKATASAIHQIKPGGNKAIITLANGENIVLENHGVGNIGEQGGLQIYKDKKGHISYINTKKATNPNQINSIRTPRAGQYQLTLSDGTNVWLNAETTLSYPVSFDQQANRTVTLSGEAYFEVAKMKGKPFIVKTQATAGPNREMDIEVLGTHFNVMAYNDEPKFKTTLLEGSVKVKSAGQERTLRPGEQALVATDLTVKEADLDLEMAWKNGLISFSKADVKTIMRQVARWYDVDVIYEGNISTRRFSGDLPRNSDILKVLKVLKTGKINYEINNRTITIKP